MKERVSETINNMSFATDPSERDKIDEVLRLPGLKFPKGELVLGKKNVDLMMALGAIDTERHRAGRQLLVVKRLCVLYHAVLSVYRDCPRDINHARFYEVALLSISDKHRDMTKYLTPESLRHVIDLYRKAFARSGWKVIKKADEEIIRGQMNSLFRHDGRRSTAGKTILETTEGTTEVLDPIEPIGDRVRLEKLVKMWMVVRGEKRAKTTPETPEIADPVFPQQKPDESAHAYMLRVKDAFRDLREENECLEHMNADMRAAKRACHDGHCDEIKQCDEQIEKLLATVDEKNDRINELEKRLGADGDH